MQGPKSRAMWPKSFNVSNITVKEFKKIRMTHSTFLNGSSSPIQIWSKLKSYFLLKAIYQERQLLQALHEMSFKFRKVKYK